METKTRRFGRAFWPQIGLTMLVTALFGCSAAPDRESSMEEATVKGTVKVRGKLLEAESSTSARSIPIAG